MKFNNLVNTSFSYGQADQITDIRKFIFNLTGRVNNRFWIVSPFISSLPFLSELFNFERLKKFITTYNIEIQII